MSGSLRIVAERIGAAQKHDHFDLAFTNGVDPATARPAPFRGRTLDSVIHRPSIRSCRDSDPNPWTTPSMAPICDVRPITRRVAVKHLIMDGRIVVGVGNIYANEALFRAGIQPSRASNRIALSRYLELAEAIKTVLTQAIAEGGTTLRDFQQEDGRPGYFAQQLQVYGKAGEPCPRCGSAIRAKVVGQRSTFYCGRCQH